MVFTISKVASKKLKQNFERALAACQALVDEIKINYDADEVPHMISGEFKHLIVDVRYHFERLSDARGRHSHVVCKTVPECAVNVDANAICCHP